MNSASLLLWSTLAAVVGALFVLIAFFVQLGWVITLGVALTAFGFLADDKAWFHHNSELPRWLIGGGLILIGIKLVAFLGWFGWVGLGIIAVSGGLYFLADKMNDSYY